MKKILSLLYILTLAVGLFSVRQEAVFALDAYLSADKISVNGDIYIDSGLVNVASNQTFGYRYYLPKGFTCGDTIIVDNPESPGMAQRTTKPNTTIQNNVMPGCQTNVQGEIALTIINVANQTQCTIASGIWTGSICSFDGSGFQLPLQAGRCYSLNSNTITESSKFNLITCPPSTLTSLGSNCAVINNPPIPGFYTINCTTGRAIVIDENGDAVCAGASDRECVQTDGRYRCWDGSAIAIAQGSTCPVNPDSVNITLCENSGGDWVSSSKSCTCTSPLTLNGNVCNDPANPEPATATVDEFSDEAIDFGEEGCDGFDDNNKPETLNKDNCGIINILVEGINFLSAVAGIVFVLSIMISGFQYMTARDNAGQVQKAKSRIVMTIIALALYIFMYSLLNFLVPGGVLP